MRVFVGCTLLSAAALKGVGLATESQTPDLIPTAWRLSLALVIGELALGTWLLLGMWSRTARAIAVVCFTGFTVWSLAQGVAGQPSCGCLGAVTVSPWLMAAFDAGCLTALLTAGPWRPWVGSPAAAWWAACGIAVLAAGVGLRVYQSATDLARHADGLFAETRHDFGPLDQAETAVHTFELVNDRGYAVEVVESPPTCTCSRIPDLSGRVVPAGGRLAVPVSLDTEEASGGLAGGVSLFARRDTR